MRFPEEVKKKKGYENIFEETMDENLPNVEKEIVNKFKRLKDFLG